MPRLRQDRLQLAEALGGPVVAVVAEEEDFHRLRRLGERRGGEKERRGGRRGEFGAAW